MIDDAYISFRSVDNLIHGHGLRWNTFERVQAFTNTLWTLTLAAFVSVTGEIYYTALLLEIGLSVLAVWLLARGARTTMIAAGCVATLSLSKAFVDYSTSGLENALSHVLVVLFAAEYLSSAGPSPRRLRRLTLYASLGLLNRLDLAVLFFPCLVEAAWATRPSWSTRSGRIELLAALAVGASPFVAWELFSLFYYGALIPNSALAKLTSGVPTSSLMGYGLSYFRDSFAGDPLTLLVTVFGVCAGLARGDRRTRSLAAGVVLSLAYVLCVGGCHMSGRFFTVPLVVAVAILSRVSWPGSTRLLASGAVTALAAAWMGRFPTLTNEYFSQRSEWNYHIGDYRRVELSKTGLLTRSASQLGPEHDWIALGKAARDRPDEVPIWGGMGFAGYYAGPDVSAIDEYGLTDPLLSRLPIPDGRHQTNIMMGHFQRSIPDGYEATVRHRGKNEIRHPALHAYYDKLAFVTQGPLWSGRRLLATLMLNLGAYRSLLDDYAVFQDQKLAAARDLPPARLTNPADALQDCPNWYRPCASSGVAFTDAGVRVTLEHPMRATAVEVDLDPGDFSVAFWRDSRVVGRSTLRAVERARTTLVVPTSASDEGYDAVSLTPAAAQSGLLRYFRPSS